MGVSVCASNEFQCDGTRCISKSQKCNQEIDCLDETDEQNCPRTAGKSIIYFYTILELFIGKTHNDAKIFLLPKTSCHINANLLTSANNEKNEYFIWFYF